MKGKIVVTGGTGYIGSHTIVDLLEQDYEVICIDNLVNSSINVVDNIEKITGKKIIFYQADLCNLQETKNIFKQHPDITGIIHFAALKSVGESVIRPLLYFQNNIDSLLNVIECALALRDFKVFIFSSSCTVYGNPDTYPVTELTPLQEAASPYGRTKQVGEMILKDCFRNTPIKIGILRYFNPAGAHFSNLIGEDSKNEASNLIPIITETAIGKRNSMTVFGTDYNTSDGTCIRDYIHVSDIASAHTQILSSAINNVEFNNYDIFNIGLGYGLTVLQVIHSFEEITGIKLNYSLGKKRPGDVPAIYSDSKKIKTEIGWVPKYTINDIVETAWNWEKHRSNVKL